VDEADFTALLDAAEAGFATLLGANGVCQDNVRPRILGAFGALGAMTVAGMRPNRIALWEQRSHLSQNGL